MMNSHYAASLMLLSLATGCVESTAPVDAGSTPGKRTSNSTTEEISAGRERAVVKVTDAAAAKFKEALAAEPTKHIRLSVKQEGPTGFMYDLQFDDSVDEVDFVDNSHGFAIVVDPKSSILLEGATIDWLTQPNGKAGFKFDNPNAVER
jgi:iron-sulfur cluster assembly accessory protein